MTFDNTPIPDIDTAQDPIGCADDLRQRWRALMGPLGFSESLLWFAFIDSDHRLIPALNRLPLPEPDGLLAELLLTRIRETISDLPGLTVAMLLTRPGRDGLTVADQQWAQMLTDEARARGVPMHPVHRANDIELVTIPTAASEAAA